MTQCRITLFDKLNWYIEYMKQKRQKELDQKKQKTINQLPILEENAKCNKEMEMQQKQKSKENIENYFMKRCQSYQQALKMVNPLFLKTSKHSFLAL